MSLPIPALTGANTINQLVADVNTIKLLAANTASTVANSTFQAALANTNSYIAMKANTSNPIFNGIIGIGISPTRTLDVNGYAQIGSTAEGKLGIGEKLSTGAAHIELGEGRTGSGYAWIDLIGDTTYTDYGLRILRGNSGSNTTSNMWHRGTGDFNFVTQEAAPIIFYTNNTERMRIDSSGNLGIATAIDHNGRLSIKSTGTEQHLVLEQANVTTDGWGIYGANGGNFEISRMTGTTTFTPRVTINSSGLRVHAGMIIYSTQIEQDNAAGLTLNSSHGSGGIYFSIAGSERARITSGGTLAVGTTGGLNSELIHARASSGTISTLYNSGATGDVLRLYHENTAVTAFSIWGGGAQRGFISSPVSSDGLIFGTSSTERMRLAANGNVLIGTSTSDKQLTLYSATDASQGISLRNQSAGTSAASYISMGNDSDALDGQIFLTGSMNTSLAGTRSLNFLSNIGAFGFYRNRLSPVATMVMDTSGNVGIGTSPTTTLDVAGTARATQGMPIASQSANTKTLALTDNGYYVRCSNSTTMTVTIPANATVAFPTGAEMVFFQVGAGNVQFANAAGVTVNSKDDALFLTGQFSAATLKKITTNTWDLIGDLA
jgi:hypothetical protein